MAQVLRQLPRSSHPDLLVGHDHFDDAGVFRLDDAIALVQTVDFFPPLVDDPYTFGQIAAANALSDVYAMGGAPLTALNIVGFPDKDLPMETLAEILRGGAERVAAAGAVVVGGHSVRDNEVKYGLSVTGRIDPRRIVTNGGARPGDALILTKPIGSGTLTSAAKRDLIGEADLAECIATIARGVRGATDITGFGLVGHAFEVAEASGVGIRIEAQRVPLLARAMEFAAQGVLTRAHAGTLAHVGSRLHADGVDATLRNLLCDAQTSGGLLICVAADRADELLADLHARDVKAAAVVGDVTDAAKPFVALH